MGRQSNLYLRHESCTGDTLKMRWTSALLKQIAPGRIWTGKNRLAHKPTEAIVERLHKRLAIEEQNMFYLRHPFLTVEQGHGFSKELGKAQQKYLAFKASNVRPYRPHVRVEERLKSALDSTNAWD